MPFKVGGFPHSRDPPTCFSPNSANFEGEIDEIRISNIMRYPAEDKLTIIRGKLPYAGLDLSYMVQLGADAAVGEPSWDIAMGDLPAGLSLSGGVIQGQPKEIAEDRELTVGTRDESGASDEHTFTITVARGRLVTESLPPAFIGCLYSAELTTEYMAEPLTWKVISGALPNGVTFDEQVGKFAGRASEKGRARLSVRVIDANGSEDQANFTIKVLPSELRITGSGLVTPDEHTVVLYDWQGPNGRLIKDRMGGGEALTLTYTNMGGNRRFSWPGREGRFPQETGRGEHGYATIGKGISSLDLKTCKAEWTADDSGAFNYLGFGNFFGQIGEIRISNVRRYV